MMTREAGLERRIKSYDESIEQLQRMRDEKQAMLDQYQSHISLEGTLYENCI
jgi:peptidoglycan hydrolase CwlO-like protein